MRGKLNQISLIALSLSLGLGIAMPSTASADAKSSIRLIKAEKAYIEAKKEWKSNKKRYEAYISQRDKIDQDHGDVELKFWERRQKFLLDHARELNQTRTDRNAFEKTYRDKRREYDRLTRERDETNAALTRLTLFIDKGTATGIEKIKAKKLRRKIDQLDAQLKTELDAQKKMQTDFKKADSAHKAKIKQLWDNQPKKGELFDNDEIHKQRREDLKRPLTSFDVEDDRARTESTAIAFFGELLKNQPIYVKQVEAIGTTGPWYSAVWETDPLATAQQPSQLTQEGYRKAISDIDAEIAKLDAEIDKGNRLLQRLREDWKHQSELASSALLAIENNEVQNAVIAASIETGAVIGAFAVSGGLAAPAAHGAASSFLAYIGSAGGRQLAKLTPELLAKSTSLMNSTMQRYTVRQALTYTKKAVGYATRHITKTLKAVDNDTVSWFKFVTDMYASKDANFSFNNNESLVGEKGVMRAAIGIGVGDVIETGISGGWRDFATTITGKVGGKAATAAQLKQAGNLAGLAVAATGSKMAVRFIYDLRKDSYQWDAYEAQSAAWTSQHAYFAALAVRNGYLIEKSYLTESKQALEQLREHGPRSLKKVVTTDNAIVKDDVHQIKITFSKPLDKAPNVTVNGKYTGAARPFEGSRKIWETSVSPSLFGEETKEVKLRVKISEKERPFKKLDSNPKTPLELTSLERGSWRGFERGVDTNHILHLRKKDEKHADIPCPRGTTSIISSDVNRACDVFDPVTKSCLIKEAHKDPKIENYGHWEGHGGLCLDESGKPIEFTDPKTGARRYYTGFDVIQKGLHQLQKNSSGTLRDHLNRAEEMQKYFRALKNQHK